MFSLLDHRLLARLGALALIVGAVPTAQDVLRGDKLRAGGAWAILMLAGALAIYAAYQDKRHERELHQAVRDKTLEIQRRVPVPEASDPKLQALQLVQSELQFRLNFMLQAKRDGRYPLDTDWEMRYWDQHTWLGGERGAVFRTARDAYHEQHRIACIQGRRGKWGSRRVRKKDRLDEAIATVEKGVAVLQEEIDKLQS